MSIVDHQSQLLIEDVFTKLNGIEHKINEVFRKLVDIEKAINMKNKKGYHVFNKLNEVRPLYQGFSEAAAKKWIEDVISRCVHEDKLNCRCLGKHLYVKEVELP
jgi:hypothetical protein